LKKECHFEFERFVAKYKKTYSTDIHPKRRTIFCENWKEVAEINAKQLAWSAGINEYSDLTWPEFKDMFTMKTAQNCSATEGSEVSHWVKLGVAPVEMDWRNVTCGETSCVSMVKNQGKCGR
jgi:cathepsin H